MCWGRKSGFSKIFYWTGLTADAAALEETLRFIPFGVRAAALCANPLSTKKSTKNHPKINQKATNNLFEIYPKSTKNGPPEGPGRLLGGSLRLLGPSWNEFESEDSSKVDLGALLGRSGRLLGPSWSETEGQDGSKLGPKREVLGVQKRIENGCIIGSLLGSTRSCLLLVRSEFFKVLMDFKPCVGSILRSKMEPSWH